MNDSIKTKNIGNVKVDTIFKKKMPMPCHGMRASFLFFFTDIFIENVVAKFKYRSDNEPIYDRV